MKTDKLFVYGSLMGGIQSPIANYLKSKSTFLGEGFVYGQLYDIGKYPGLLYDNQLPSKVIGHIFQLSNPAEMLPNLDYYECVGEGFEPPNEYRREAITVHLNGENLLCWAYLYNSATDNLHQIESGNYLAYFQQNQKYQDFVNALNDFSRR